MLFMSGEFFRVGIRPLAHLYGICTENLYGMGLLGPTAGKTSEQQ